jgi:o-succinylbenzoate---CoA ligase
MKTIYDLLKEFNSNLKIDNDKSFIIGKSEILTYHSLNQKTIGISKKFKDSGISKDEIVAILLDSSPNFIVAVLSLWMIEAIPVPINLKLSPPEIQEQIKFLSCRFVVIDDSHKEKINLNGRQLIKLSFYNCNIDNINIDLSFDENRTAVIMFTSGSYGKPKAVELLFSNLINSAKIGNNYLIQTSEDRWLASLPFYHIGGFSIIFRALVFGTTLVIPADLKIESIITSIRKHKPTLISLVSTQMKNLLDKNFQPNQEMRCVLLGGGFIDSSIMKEAITKGWNVSKVYGSTETSSFVTVLSPEEFLLKPESVGKPIYPNEVLICDDNRNELSNHLEGEIVVKSLAVMKSYLNDETAINNKSVDGVYFTGDFGYKDSEGYLYLTNKRSDFIVTGGENINQIEVEEAILKFPNVKEACVFGINDVQWGQKVVAAIVTMRESRFTLDELKEFLKDKIASFKIPKLIYFVDELPKTELGKVKRESVRKLFIDAC